MTFNQPLPIPSGAIVLTEDEKNTLRKYWARVEEAKSAMASAHESLSDICIAIASRAGCADQQFKLSADFGCLIPDTTQELA